MQREVLCEGKLQLLPYAGFNLICGSQGKSRSKEIMITSIFASVLCTTPGL